MRAGALGDPGGDSDAAVVLAHSSRERTGLTMCNCSEGKFERTDKGFTGQNLHPFAQTFLTAKIGATCAAPPVHDCGYVALRNRLSSIAWHEAYEDTKTIKDVAMRAYQHEKSYREKLKKMIAEHYAQGLTKAGQ
jgi:hypothetical protein